MVKSIRQVTRICRLPGNAEFVDDSLDYAAADGLTEAVQARDTGFLYGWLMAGFSYQGISDRIADGYIAAHGNARWEDLQSAIANHRCGCPKLAGFGAYKGCGYRKTAASCRNPVDLPDCPVPTLPLRKGDLNQLAFSLFLFLCERCDGDLVGFIDATFTAVDNTIPDDPVGAKRQALITALSGVHAISAKLIAMTFATLLMVGDPDRPDWIAVGRSMVAIDSLVHNFLHRTGILAAFGKSHGYGPGCYGPKGCGSVVYELAKRIDASRINADYPVSFPRLVQFAIWSFCAETYQDICNGRQINDRFPCERTDCPVGDRCGRVPLRPSSSAEGAIKLIAK